ncbi:unnamed protein product [Camellia sinensis]
MDLEQILQEVQHRWLRPAEIYEVLRNHKKFHLTPEPPARPPGTSKGVQLPIQLCKVSGRPYGEASEKFTSELGIVTRKFALQNEPLWTDISEEYKETLIAYLQEGFKFTNEPYDIESILNLMHDLYKSYRHDLQQHFRSFPTMESTLADPPENMEKEVWRFLCEKWSDKDYKVRCGKNKLNREKLKVLHTASSKAFKKVQYDETVPLERNLDLLSYTKRRILVRKKRHGCMLMLRLDYKLEKQQDKAIEDGSGLLSDEQLSIEVFGQKSGYVRGLGHGRNQVQHYLENVPMPNLRGIMRLLQGRLKSNEESIRSWWEEFISWSPIAREYNAKVDFLMQQINRRGPSIDSSSYVLQPCVDLKLGSSLLDFECHFNEVFEKKMR